MHRIDSVPLLLLVRSGSSLGSPVAICYVLRNCASLLLTRAPCGHRNQSIVAAVWIDVLSAGNDLWNAIQVHNPASTLHEHVQLDEGQHFENNVLEYDLCHFKKVS